MRGNLKIYIYLAGYKNYSEFAKDVGLAKCTVSNIINNKDQKISLETKLKIIKKLNEKLQTNQQNFKHKIKILQMPLTIYDIFPETTHIDTTVFGSKKEVA